MSVVIKGSGRRAALEFSVAEPAVEPTAEESVRLLEAFRAILCPATRAQVLQLVESLPPKVLTRGAA